MTNGVHTRQKAQKHSVSRMSCLWYSSHAAQVLSGLYVSAPRTVTDRRNGPSNTHQNSHTHKHLWMNVFIVHFSYKIKDNKTEPRILQVFKCDSLTVYSLETSVLAFPGPLYLSKQVTTLQTNALKHTHLHPATKPHCVVLYIIHLHTAHSYECRNAHTAHEDK